MTAERRLAILVFVGAAAAPVVIALLSPQGSAHTVTPAALSLIVVMTTATLGFRSAAIAAAVSGATAVWFFNTKPAESFAIDRTDDMVAVGALLVVGLVCAALLGTLSKRNQEMRTHGATVQVAAAIDRETLNAIQQAILPTAPPSVDGVRITTAYRMAGPSAGTLGGDFYVLVPFDNGSLGIGIGDVAGHGAAAVAAMANVRMTLRSVATITPDPALAMWDPLESTCRHASLSIL